jgi:hypothetical protein
MSAHLGGSWERLPSNLGVRAPVNEGERPVPNAPKTPTRTFRCPDVLWNAAKDKAAIEEKTVTDVLIEALVAFTQE